MSCAQMSVNITYVCENVIMPLYKAIVTPPLECCIHKWRPFHKKDIDKLDRVQRSATKLIPELKEFCYEKRLLHCGLTLETRD